MKGDAKLQFCIEMQLPAVTHKLWESKTRRLNWTAKMLMWNTALMLLGLKRDRRPSIEMADLRCLWRHRLRWQSIRVRDQWALVCGLCKLIYVHRKLIVFKLGNCVDEIQRIMQFLHAFMLIHNLTVLRSWPTAWACVLCWFVSASVGWSHSHSSEWYYSLHNNILSTKLTLKQCHYLT